MSVPALVLVVDDHPVVRRGLTALLEAQEWVGAVHEAATVADATVAANRHPFDLAVVDLRLPDGDGLAVLDTLTARAPGCRSLVLTMELDARTAAAAMRAGAICCLAKDAPPETIVDTVRAVHAGEPVAPLPDGVRATVLDPFAGLSPRERRVAALVAEGATNSEIARTLRISEKTVRNQVCTIADKLGVRGRVGITIRGRGGGSGAGECPPSPEPPR